MKISYKNLFKFYNYNHFWAGIVLFALLCIPPLIDLYMQAIVAESKDFFNHQDKQNSQTIHAEQNKITLRYGVSLLLFFVMNSLKVIVLSVYLRTSSFEIFNDLINKFFNSKVQPTVLNYYKKNGLDLQRNLQSIDIRTTTELDISLTVIFEHLDIIVFASVSSLLFLAVGIPFFVINVAIVVAMIHYSRKISDARRLSQSKINEFIKKVIQQRSQIQSYQKSQFFFDKYTVLNRQDITYELNEDWLLQALSILFELIIILMLMTVLIVSLTKFHEIHLQNQAFLQLSISFLIGFLNGGRLDLKVFKAVDRQVVGISSLFKIGENNNHRIHVFKDLPSSEIFSVSFEDFSVRFFSEQLTQLNLNFSKGQRVVCICSRQDPIKLVFLALFRLFRKENVKGFVKVNGIDLYEQKITRQCIQKYVHVISDEIVRNLGQTILEYLQYAFPNKTTEEIHFEMANLWRILKCQPLFGFETKIQDLKGCSSDCFRLLIELLSKCPVLVIEHTLDDLGIQKKQNLIKWLIQSSDISILIQLTDRSDIVSQYPRKIYVENGRILREKYNDPR